jgi:hypothetical protein
MAEALAVASLAIPLVLEAYKLLHAACSKIKTNKHERLLLLKFSRELAIAVDDYVRVTSPSQSLKNEVEMLTRCVRFVFTAFSLLAR